jgi:hypothetical protein
MNTAQKINENDEILEELISLQSLDVDNIHFGIGNPWNLTHRATREENNTIVNFKENQYDVVEIPSGSDWQGYEFNASIENLYDTRNWCNGTFSFGSDNGYTGPATNDSVDPRISQNKYQNWSFYYVDDQTVYNNNSGSGNYVQDISGHDAIELRLNGSYFLAPPDAYGYDQGDRCGWTTSFRIPRGKVIDSELQFDVFPDHLMQFNIFDLKFLVNDVLIYSIGTYELEQRSGGAHKWKTFSIPQEIWQNSSNVYPSILNNTVITLNATLEFTSGTSYYWWLNNNSYQQLYLDNIKLITKSEVKPEQINLKLNETYVDNVDWGKGSVGLSGNWQDDTYLCNFSSEDMYDLDDYTIDFSMDSIYSTIQHTPETNNETNYNSIGTLYSVENSSIVEWDSYAYVSVPAEYAEREMRIDFPTDLNITWISTPQDPSTNQLSKCINTTPGELLVPVNNISSTPNGYWKLKGVSPNYCENLEIYNNNTGLWVLNNTFLSGDYINITAKINNSPLISGYIQQTIAQLYIRFPNGSLWTEMGQIKNVNITGSVYFDNFQIPNSHPFYIAGEYEVIVTWNNSYNTLGINETGIIYDKFNVIHNSKLTPDQGEYYIQNVIDDRVKNIKVFFKDIVDNNSIENAAVYSIFKTVMYNFSEISPGFYLLEFNASKADLGNNTLTIHANSTFYINREINITLYVIKETELSIDKQFCSVFWNENFTIYFNFTEKNTGIGIDTTISHNWVGDNYLNRIAQGRYNLTCNTTVYEVNKLYKLNLDINKYGYEIQSALINIQISEINTSLEVQLNGTSSSTIEFFNLSLGDSLNITAWYKDYTTTLVDSASITINGTGIAKTLLPHTLYPQYNLTITAEEFGIGVNFLKIYAYKGNHTLRSVFFAVIVSERPTSLQLFLDGVPKLENDITTIQVGEIINITVVLKDELINEHLSNASVFILGKGTLDENVTLKHYNITIKAEDLNQGFTILTLQAQKQNFENQTIHFIIEVIERKTQIQLLLNNENKTLDKSLVLLYGKTLNVTVRYTDNVTKDHISSAKIQFFGEEIDYNLSENFVLDQYELLINTDQLKIGVNFITVIANKTNYQLYSLLLKITVSEISTEIEPVSGLSVETIKPGQSFTIALTLKDLNYTTTVKNAVITYIWELGEGTLTDLDNDGTYEAILENVPEGTYTIIFIIQTGDQYDFKRYSITLNAIFSVEEFFMFLIILIIAVSAAAVLGIYIIAYQKVLKYPKSVRKVRGSRKKLKKKKAPKLDLMSREQSLDYIFENELGDYSKTLKKKFK